MTAITFQLPALLPVLLLLTGAVCAFVIGRPRIVWGIAQISSLFSLAIAIILVIKIQSVGVISYSMGGWQAPIGIEYRVDALNAWVLVLITFISSVTLPFARVSVRQEILKRNSNLFYCLWLLNIAGLSGMVITADAFNVFVFLEISSLSTYALVSMNRRREALVAAFRYLVMGSVGASFVLLGIGLMYVLTGTLNMQDLAQRLPLHSDKNSLHAAFAFITIGFGLKMAMFPLHAWLPKAYETASTSVSVLISATATKVALYLWIRFAIDIFGVAYLESISVGYLMIGVALVAMIYGSFQACIQHNLKGILAWSSVAQVSYMILGVALLSELGLIASITHLFNHALIKSALFMAAGCMIYRLGGCEVVQLNGKAKFMPWTFAAFCLLALSIIGVPGTAGFISKWYLLQAVLSLSGSANDAGTFLHTSIAFAIVAVIIVSSLMAVVYTGKVIEKAYFGRHATSDAISKPQEAPMSLLLPLWLLVALNIYVGFNTQFTVGAGMSAARMLIQ